MSHTEDKKEAKTIADNDVDTVIGHLVGGRVSNRSKADLGDALKKADAPLIGRASQDAGIGRIAGRGKQ